MRRLFTILCYVWLFAVLPEIARCAIYNVTVGGPGVLRYNPEFVNAEPGDTIRFHFQQKNHTVTQSSLKAPCQHIAGGFDTGFIPVSDSVDSGFPVAELGVMDRSPVWVYCRQADHCQRGMVFAVNPEDKFDIFKSTAMGQPASSSSSLSSATIPPTTLANATSAVATMTASSDVTVVTVTATVTTTALPSQAPSATPTSTDHRVTVGGPGLLTFQPSTLKADVGDTITFEFYQNNHTVTASSFDRPCEPLSSTSTTGQVGFDSGFMPVAATSTTFPTFTIQVNDTKPIWAYCRQGNHCGQGMVFAANAVEDGPNNFSAFQALAKQLNGTTSGNAGSLADNSAIGNAGITAMLASVTAMLIAGSLL